MRTYYLDFIKKGQRLRAPSGQEIGPFDASLTPTYALDLDFDFNLVSYDVVTSGSLVTLYGIPISFLYQAVNFVGANITLSGGFGKGLPLSNPSNSGILLYGTVYDAYANWEGTSQSLNWVVNALVCKSDIPYYQNTLQEAPESINFSVLRGQPIQPAISMAISQAFPDYELSVNIDNSRLIASENYNITSSSMPSFASNIKQISQQLIKDPDYFGVNIALNGRTITVYDNTNPNLQRVIQLEAYEIIGQPTWLQYPNISVKVPLRGNIRVSDIIQLPMGTDQANSILNISQQNSFSRARSMTAFNNRFVVISVRHIGGYQKADANNNWVTILEATALPQNS